MTAHILVIEDDSAIAFGLRTNLAFDGHTVDSVGTRAAAQAWFEECSAPPDLIVLDLMLPDGTGFEVMEDLGRSSYTGLVLVLSARKEETDKVGALRMGADDYVTKPFSLAELMARVEALLRRSKGAGGPAAVAAAAANGAGTATAGTAAAGNAAAGNAAAGNAAAGNGMAANGIAAAVAVATASPEARVRFGRCEVDLPARTLRVDGDPVTLTRLEFDLLVYFTQHPGEALSRGRLLRDVWGLTHDGSARTVDNVVAHLRTKLGEDADRPRHLRTLRGAGYRFQLLPEEDPRG